MKILNVKFVKSFAKANEIKNYGIPEIAIVGRSNVGKSSFVNYFTNSKIAKTSALPGRTRLVNYFSVNNDKFMLVDLPGYGYAKVSKEEQDKWGDMIEGYFENSRWLKHVIFLVDIRHEPSIKDIQMASYLFQNQISYTVVTTKCDKLSKSQISTQKQLIASVLKLGIDNIIVTSSNAKIGAEDVAKRIEQFI